MDWGSTIAPAEIEASGVLFGTTLQIRTLDDATDPATAITQFNKFTAPATGALLPQGVAVPGRGRQRRVTDLVTTASNGSYPLRAAMA